MDGLISRHLLSPAERLLDLFPAVVVQGARQVGKSTFARMLAQGRPADTVTLDDPQFLSAARTDPVAFINQSSGRTLVIDEIQRAPDLVLPIKAAIDRDRTPGRFILTGSADLLRVERTPDSLAGRAVSIDLFGLSQGELAGRREDFVARALELRPGYVSSWQRSDYAHAIGRGGYPEVRAYDWADASLWIDSYLRRIVQRDATDLRRSVSPERLHAILRLIAANQAGELVKSRLAEQSGLPATTLPGYLDLVEALYLVRLLPAWTPNLTRRETGRPKTVIADSTLALRLARLTPEQLIPVVGGEHFGAMLEGFVIGELMRQQGWSSVPYELFFFRDRNGPEVDLIAELEDGRVLAIEVKAAESARREHFAGLDTLARRLGDRLAAGIVLCTSGTSQRFGERMWSLPVAAIWEL